MNDDIKNLNSAIARLIEAGRIKPGERRMCLTLEFRELEEADRIADEAIATAKQNAKQQD